MATLDIVVAIAFAAVIVFMLSKKVKFAKKSSFDVENNTYSESNSDTDWETKELDGIVLMLLLKVTDFNVVYPENSVA